MTAGEESQLIQFVHQLVQQGGLKKKRKIAQKKRFSCKECGQKFKSRAALGGHVSSAHRGGNPNAREPRLLPGCFEMGKRR